MAERVEIRGGELDGSVLENAASEATLLRLVESLERMSRGSGQGGQRPGADPAAAARLQNLYNESKKKGVTATDKFSSATKSATTAVSDFASGVTGAIKGLFSAIDKAGAAGINLAFSGATPTVTQFTEALATFLPMGQTIRALGTTVETAIKDFREISTVGADLGTGLLAIKKRAIEANLPLETFKKVITENAQGLNTLTGSVSTGAMRFSQISGEVQRLRPQFANLGMTMEETGEFTASYLSQQQRLGQLQNMTIRQQTQGAIQYNLELDKLSRATGIQRKALDDANQRTALDTKLRTSLGKLDVESRNRFTARMEQLRAAGAGDMAQAIENLVATQGVALTPEMKKAVLAFQSAGVDISSIAKDIYSGSKDSITNLEQGLKKGAAAANTMGDVDRSLATLSDVAGARVPQFLLLQLQGLEKGFDNYKQAAQAQSNSIADATKNLANFDGAVLEARNKLSEALMPALDQMMNTAGSFVNLMGPDGPFMKAISDATTTVSGYINQFIADAQSVGIVQAFQNLWKQLYTDSLPYVERYWNELLTYSKNILLPKLLELGESLKKGLYELFTSGPVVSALVAGIGLLFGAKMVKSAITSIPDYAKDTYNRTKGAMDAARAAGPQAPGAVANQGLKQFGKSAAKNIAKGALKFIPGVGLVIGTADAVSSAWNAEETLGIPTGPDGKPVRSVTGGERLSAGIGGLIESATFGGISAQTAAKSISKITGAGPTTDIGAQKPISPAAETPATKSAVESKPAVPQKTSAITDTNTQLAELNTTMTRVAELIEESNKHLSKVKTNTKATSGNLA